MKKINSFEYGEFSRGNLEEWTPEIFRTDDSLPKTCFVEIYRKHAPFEDEEKHKKLSEYEYYTHNLFSTRKFFNSFNFNTDKICKNGDLTSNGSEYTIDDSDISEHCYTM